MKTNYVLYLVALLMMACGERPMQELETVSSKESPVKEDSEPTENATELSDRQMEAMRQKCEAYYASMNVHDSVRIAYLERILADNKSKLTVNNRRFLTQLKQEFSNSNPKQPRLTIEQVLFPVFRIPNQEPGIIGHPVPDKDLLTEYTDLSAEKALLNRRLKNRAVSADTANLQHFPEVLDSLYPAGKPRIHLYTTKTTRKSRVQDLGHYVSTCSEYYHYTFDRQALQSEDKVLFASRLPLDLTYESNPAFDTWYRSNLIPECADCPDSHNEARSVAKLTGVENLYFMYADAFPDNRELDTPLRALVAKGENGKWLYLWYSDIDNYGCSCL